MKCSQFKYFRWAFIVTVLGLATSFCLGFSTTGSWSGAASFLILAGLLSILEISLSFDNAIVNANTLKSMTPKWQKRFLTWGILIAVFGMRIIFPLGVVSVATGVGPISAMQMAAAQPQEYARIMEESHLLIAAFGGTFLMMVALSFFIDKEKDLHWFNGLEGRLRKFAALPGIAIILVLLVIFSFMYCLEQGEQLPFLTSATLGLLAFVALQFLGYLLDKPSKTQGAVQTGALGAFLYLEMLDASFSFDGVIGAFALTQNIFLIAIGLGIGAMYVRSFTIMIVEKNTLAQFRYLEHGAFYSIFALSLVMFSQTLLDIPELLSGMIGVSLIVFSLISSVRYNHRRIT